MRIVAPMPQEGGPRIPQNLIFLKNGKTHPKRKNSKTSRNMPKLGIRPSTRGLSSIGKRGFRVEQEYPKTIFFEKQKKLSKTQKVKKRLEVCQNQRYALRPEVSNPSGSMVSTMFCKARSAKKTFFCAAIFDNLQTKMIKSETTSFQYLSPRIPKL